MGDQYAIVTITKVELFLPEPIIPSWDIVYHALPGGSGKEATDETFTGAAFQKGTTTKVTDQEWNNRVNLSLLSRASASRTVVIKIFKQSSLSGKRRAVIETSLPVSDLLRSQTKQVVSQELTDSKGGKIIVNLTCEVTGVQYWLKQLKKATEESATAPKSPEDSGKSKDAKSKRKSKTKSDEETITEAPGSETTDSFVHDLVSLSSTSQYRDKFISYLTHKDSTKLLLKFFEVYVSRLGRAFQILRPNLTDSGSVKKRHSLSGSLGDSGSLNNSGSTPQSKSRRKKDAILIFVEKRRETALQLMDGLLKDPLIRKAFLDAEYIQKVIEWACDPSFGHVAAAGLSSFKPLFFTDALQETLGRAGVIHFLVHILNPKTDFGRNAPEEVTTVAMQILPYFSNRFHPIFIKADVMVCIENLLAEVEPQLFQRGVELMLFVSSTKADEVLSRFLPIFDSSLAKFAAQIKEVGERLALYRGVGDSLASLDTNPVLLGVDTLLKLADDAQKMEQAEPPLLNMIKPIIKESAIPTGLLTSMIRGGPVPPPPPGPVVAAPVPPPPPPAPVAKLSARERNRTLIEQLSGQVARMLENPDADEAEVARILGRIEELGTDEPEPEEETPIVATPPAGPATPPAPLAPVPRLIRAHVGLDDGDDLLSFNVAPASPTMTTTTTTTTYTSPSAMTRRSSLISPRRDVATPTANRDEVFPLLDEVQFGAPTPPPLPLSPSARRRSSGIIDIVDSPAIDRNTPRTRKALGRRRSASPPPRSRIAAPITTTASHPRRELRDSINSLEALMNDLNGLGGKDDEDLNANSVWLAPSAGPESDLYVPPTAASDSDSISLGEDDEEEEEKKKKTATAPVQDKLRRSMNRLTQEMSNLQAFAQTLTPSSSAAQVQIEEAPIGRAGSQLDPEIEFLIATQNVEDDSFVPGDVDTALFEGFSFPDNPPLGRSNSSLSISSSDSETSTGSGSGSESSVDLTLLLRTAVPPPPPPPPANVGANAMAAAAAPPPPPPQAIQLRPDVIPPPPGAPYSAPDPAPSKALDPAELEELGRLRAQMADLERLATAPLQPILRLSTGQEERYLKTGLIPSLLSIMTHCSSIKLKETILDLVGKITAGQHEHVLQFGYIDALLSLTYAVCSQKSNGTRVSLPAHAQQCLTLVKRSLKQPTLDQVRLVAKLMQIPATWWNTLHESLLNIVLEWDLSALVLQVPQLLHGIAALLIAFGCSKLAIRAIHGAFDIKTFTVKDYNLPHDKLLLLSRLVRDSIFIQRWLSVSSLADADLTLTPLMELILGQDVMLTKSELLAYDEEIKKQTEIPKLGDDSSSPRSPSKTSEGSKKTKKKQRRTSSVTPSLSDSHGSSNSSSSASTAPSSSSSSTPASTTASSSTITATPTINVADATTEVKFKLSSLFEGAISHYNGTGGSALRSNTLGHFLLKLVATNTYTDMAAQDKINIFGILRKLPYLEALLCKEPRLLWSTITSDQTRYTFDMVTKIVLGFSSKTMKHLVAHGLATNYLQKYDSVRTKLTNSNEVKQLAVRMCLEGEAWKRVISTGSVSVMITTLQTPQSDVGLEMFRLLPKEELSDYLPVGFFETLISGCQTHLFKQSVLVEILQGITEMPIFWQYASVYNSTVQEQLIRLFFWPNANAVPYKEVTAMTSDFLKGPRALALAEKGFFVRVYRLLSTATNKNIFPNFIKLLVEIDEKQDYRLLRAAWVPKDLDLSKRIPASAAEYVNGALKDFGTDVSDWHEIASSDQAGTSMEWTTMTPGMPIAIVAYSGGTPTFGGVLPRLPRAQPHAPQGVLPPTYAVAGSQSTVRVVDPSIRIFYKERVAKPTVSGNFAAILSPRDINFVEALRLNFSNPNASHYNGNVYSYNHRTTFPGTCNTGGTSKVAIYSAPMAGTANLTCLLSICIENNVTASKALLIKVLEKLNLASPAGSQFADEAIRELSSSFFGSALMPEVAELARRICAPGYEVSTEWKPVRGSATNPENATSALKPSGCFAGYCEISPVTKHAAVLELEYEGPSDPAMANEALKESSSAPEASSAPSSSASSSSEPSSSSSSSANNKKISPVFTHFLLSCTRMQTDHAAPDYIAVFMSETPLPIDDILKVPGGSISAARKTKWPVSPKSIIHFGDLTANNPEGEKSQKALVLKSPLVTIPGSCRANHILIVGYRDANEEESTAAGAAESMGPTFDHTFIFSMVLLGTSHRGAPPVILPKFEHVLGFFKKASIMTSIHVEKNDELEGIIWRLGNDFGRRPWQNPYSAPVEVAVSLSHPLFKPNQMWIGNVIGREKNPTYWGTRLPVWFVLDLTKHTVCPTHFAFRHGYEQDNSFIRNWAFQGSNDSLTWVDLFKCQPVTHTKSFESVVYALDKPCTEFYRYFRVITNSTYYLEGSPGNPMMCCSGFELFGYVAAPLALDM